MEAASLDKEKQRRRIVISVVIVHAAFIAAWWWAAIYADIDTPVIAGQVWLPLALAWAVWPFYAALKYRRARGVWAAVIIGAVLIAPAASTIYVFSVWSIVGFAP